MIAEITLPGRPITKKNSQRIVTNRKTGRPMVIQSEQYIRYETECLWRLKQYRGPKFKSQVEVRALFYMPSKQRPDLTNCMQSVADILEKAGVIENDRNIVSWDGTRLLIDKEEPRVDIEIRRVEG